MDQTINYAIVTHYKIHLTWIHQGGLAQGCVRGFHLDPFESFDIIVLRTVGMKQICPILCDCNTR